MNRNRLVKNNLFRKSPSEAAVGVFDSGLGGLTVVKELMRHLPNEQVVYFGDTARVPYGSKSKQSIIRFSHQNADILLKHDVKMIVVACHSSSSCALDVLKKEYTVPVVGVIEPGVKSAVAKTENKRVGVIATSATVNSGAYEKLVKRLDPAVNVTSQACPLFVPLVEEGWLDKKVTFEVAEEYLKPLKKAGVDTLILGCTHYPLLKNVLRDVMGPKVRLIDSAKEVTRNIRCVLESEGLLRKSQPPPRHKLYISDRPQAFERIAKKFLGRDIQVDHLSQE